MVRRVELRQICITIFEKLSDFFMLQVTSYFTAQREACKIITHLKLIVVIDDI